MYDYGCVLLNLECKGWREMLNVVDPKDLYNPPEENFGYELEPHITIRYGFLKDKIDLNEMKSFLNEISKGLRSLQFDLMHLDIFNNDEYDVLIFKVHDNVGMLTTLNKLFGDRFECTEQEYSYTPHTTIAYLQKGTGQKYIKDSYRFKVIAKPMALTYSGDEKTSIIL